MLDFRNSILMDRRDGSGVKNARYSIARTKILILAPTSSSQPPVTPDRGISHPFPDSSGATHSQTYTKPCLRSSKQPQSNLTQVYRAPVCLLGQQRQVWCDP